MVKNEVNNRPTSTQYGEFNLIDTNTFINKVLSSIDKIQGLDIDSQILVFCIIILLINFIYFAYIFFFIVAPSIFNAIENILPVKIKSYLMKFININRKISIPFVILSAIFMAFSLLSVILILTVVVILNNS